MARDFSDGAALVQLIIRHISIRHISGSRATEVEVIPLGPHRELIIGRAASAAVRFDPRADRHVGRYHARIVWSGEGSTRFVLTDLRSRNGTFVNGVRVEEPIALNPGDVVRLGASGPELEVWWETAAVLGAWQRA